MPKYSNTEEAPDFVLNDFEGKPIRLLDYRHQKNVVLVFNRGFT